MNSATILNICDATGFEGCVLAYGHFSTIHPGHIRYLRHARNLGKRLLVALIGDGGSTVYPFNQRERAEALSLLGIADAVLLLKEDELDEVIAQLQPAVLVLGNEFKEDQVFSTSLLSSGNKDVQFSFMQVILIMPLLICSQVLNVTFASSDFPCSTLPAFAKASVIR